MAKQNDGKRLYEGLFLLEPNFATKDEQGAITLCTGILEKYGATVIKAEKWAEQKLAYEVRKNKRGTYILTAFRVEPIKVGEIELECRLTERIMRYLFTNREGVPIEKWFRRYEPVKDRAERAERAERPERPERKEEPRKEAAAV
jgi:small subunit ribosomal protein S6